ncbi:molybdopterin-dependent oxidoreductase [Halovenus sp. WSH3]|uniref:Molybdopterin-dependent oxidoreductase n=1 Tax=Halovenus carboxidivorans TaxID=2692199 RepID=A0A6B0T9Z5_9EURY|nr:molybdopterin-dependent oxidoreductase [Halovenus carboxidivorans]MXR51700.1 molybdopterin-dependent oxidoreductase [Halovenus carboxidivorans]
MIDRPDREETLTAALSAVTAVAGSFVAVGWSRQFVVAPVDQQIVNLTPGPIVTFMIENVGEAGHLVHIGLALGAVVGLFGLVSLAGVRLGTRTERPLVGGLAAGVGVWLLSAALTREPLLALAPAGPMAVFTAVGGVQTAAGSVDRSRRRTLGTLAAALGFAGTAAVTGRLLHGDAPLDAAPNAEGADERLSEAEANRLDTASDDLPGLVSDIDGFYNVDIAEFDPEVTSEEWSLTFTGDVGRELTVEFDDLIERDVENRFVTLRCVGEDLNGKKLDTAVWTGTPLGPLLDAVDPQSDCDCAMLRGDDGYYVQFPTDVLRNGFLAWGMNGKELPQSHGHPVRVLIPGHWGETNVKWLTEIELLNTETDGYWEERGWEGTGEVKTVAKLWDEGITELDDGRIELAGHAYAGTRGISRVEVSTDGGDSWADADLSDPLPDGDVWRQWRHTFDPDGSHDVVVRATDGNGTLQTEEETSSSPDGAAGWVERTVTA